MNIAKELAPAFLKELEAASTVLIGTHLNPDGDALGCALAMSLYLDGIGIENQVVCHNEAPDNLLFLPKVDTVGSVAKRENHDLGIVVDLDAMDRLGRTEEAFHRCKRIVVIDHHVPIEKPGDIRIVNPDEPATALLITRLFL